MVISRTSSSFVLLCVVFGLVVPSVLSFHSFNFPNTYGFPHSFHSPVHVPDFFSNNVFDSFLNHHQQQQKHMTLPTAAECRMTCNELVTSSLNNADYYTETDTNGALNLLIQFKDNGQPMSMRNVALKIREERSLHSLYLPHMFSPFHRAPPAAATKYILDVSMARNSPDLDGRTAAWCGCGARNVEEYRNSFTLPLGTDVHKVQAELVVLDDDTIALKVQLPKEEQNKANQRQIPQLPNMKQSPLQSQTRPAPALQAESVHTQKQSEWEHAERQRLAEIARVQAIQAQLQAEARARAAAEAEAVQKAKAEEERIRFIDQQIEMKRQHQQQQQQQYLLERQKLAQAEAEAQRQRDLAGQIEKQRQQAVYEQQHYQQQQKQKQKVQQDQQEKSQRERAARAAEAEQDRILAERKEKLFRQRYGAEGEVIRDLAGTQDRQSKKYAQMSEERRQWKDSEIILLD